MAILKKIIIAILNLESRFIISKYKPFIIAVTGSVGKTSTKDAIYSVISDNEEYLRKSEKSMNSEIGLPLTIIGVPNAWHSFSGWLSNILKGLKLILFRHEYPNCLILEIGADHPGDIEKITSWLKPDISVLTKVSDVPVHVEFFGSPEAVFKEKAFLAKAVKLTGTLVLFADSEKIMFLADEARQKGVQVITYGIEKEATIKGTFNGITYESEKPTGISFFLRIGEENREVKVGGIIGKTYMYPLLAAVAVAKARGRNIDEIVAGINNFSGPKGRMNILDGIKNSTIIDDTYNSSPDAALSALEVLKEVIVKGKKIAILGDMMELGKHSVEEHRKIGKEVARIADLLITVGQRSKGSAEEALRSGMSMEQVRSFDDSKSATQSVADIIGEGDVVLVKGSQSARMERVVVALLDKAFSPADYLVRQEREWVEKA